MRVQKRIPWLCSLGVGLAALALSGTRAGADVSSDRPGSIVIWPKVVADGTRDTIIALTNTSNTMAYAHCEYTEGTGHCSLTTDFCNLPTSDSCPTVPGGQPNICVFDFLGDPPQPCASRDFDVILTRQQPTFWRVSTGRFEDLLSGSGTACTTFPGTPPTQSCPGLFESGSVIPAPGQANNSSQIGGFRGELRCFQTAVDGSLFPGDALKGEATIEGVNSATNGGPLLSEYNSINVLADNQNPSGSPIELNGFAGYNACPLAVDTIHYARGGEDLVASSLGAACTGGNCDVQTDFTIIPCRQDYENVVATAFNVDFEAKDEFESNFSKEVPFQCWADADLAALGFTNINGATFFRTRATSTGSGICISGSGLNSFCFTDSDCGSGGVCGPTSGILAVVEEFHPTDRTTGDASLIGSAAANTHSVDSSDIVGNVPHNGSLGRPGHCRGDLTTLCTDNSDCAPGICRLTSTSCATTTMPAHNGNADCQTANAQCTGLHTPATCCSATPGVGSCNPVAGDFCDQCINDEITLIAP
jgi:hypothetical protein